MKPVLSSFFCEYEDGERVIQEVKTAHYSYYRVCLWKCFGSSRKTCARETWFPSHLDIYQHASFTLETVDLTANRDNVLLSDACVVL